MNVDRTERDNLTVHTGLPPDDPSAAIIVPDRNFPVIQHH